MLIYSCYDRYIWHVLLHCHYFCSNSLHIKFQCRTELELSRAITCDFLFGVGSKAVEILLAKNRTKFEQDKCTFFLAIRLAVEWDIISKYCWQQVRIWKLVFPKMLHIISFKYFNAKISSFFLLKFYFVYCYLGLYFHIVYMVSLKYCRAYIVWSECMFIINLKNYWICFIMLLLKTTVSGFCFLNVHNNEIAMCMLKWLLLLIFNLYCQWYLNCVLFMRRVFI